MAQGLQVMRPNRRGACWGFPLAQLPRRARAAAQRGQRVLWVAQSVPQTGVPLRRAPGQRWVPVPADAVSAAQ